MPEAHWFDPRCSRVRFGAMGETPRVEVKRSRRRTATVSAYRDGDRFVVAIPARFTAAEEREWVAKMLARVEAKERRRRPSDAHLEARARDLSKQYLAGRARPNSVRWVSNMGRRWGSCTTSERSIRLSNRLQGLPTWVIDYVLLHELTHLLHSGHGPEFWAELQAYPRTERARGFLEAVDFLERNPATGQAGSAMDHEPGAESDCDID